MGYKILGYTVWNGAKWYVKQRYSKVSDQDRQLRIRYWDCLENPNNAVYKTQEGSTQFKDFTFTKPDGK